MTSTKTCGKCENAIFERTPTGRIKRGVAGKCEEQARAKKFAQDRINLPCVRITVSTTGVWPSMEADRCIFFVKKT